MRKFLCGAAVIAGAMVSVSAAQAFPAALQPHGGDAVVVQVRNGCGLGWHRGPWGVCHPNGRPSVYGPYVAYAPPPYPGRCWWVESARGPRRVCAW